VRTPAGPLIFSPDDLAQVRTWAGDLLERMRRHGGGPDGSVTRLVYSPEWRGVMAELEGWMDAAGLVVRVDAVGSRFGRLAGAAPGPAVLAGSHVDTVVRGGAFDGAMGVAVAACAVRWLEESLGRPRLPLEVFANCEEEASRFPAGFWGGRAILGRIGPDEPDRIVDPDGVSIGEAMRACGLDPAAIPEARRQDLAAFVEPHVEQGPELERAGVPIGVVERIVGVHRLWIGVEGVAGHAGTIPMSDRHDALAGAAEIVLAVEEAARDQGPPAVATVGGIEVEPGGFNQVPGRARLTVDLRHADPDRLAALEARVRSDVERVAVRRGLAFAVDRSFAQAPVAMDQALREVLEDACREAGIAWRRMPSHAGHDAQVLAGACPSAMIFCPSRGGHSHRPDEHTDLDHVAAAVRVLAGALRRLAY
jgi:allantoate deiminase